MNSGVSDRHGREARLGSWRVMAKLMNLPSAGLWKRRVVPRGEAGADKGRAAHSSALCGNQRIPSNALLKPRRASTVAFSYLCTVKLSISALERAGRGASWRSEASAVVFTIAKVRA